MIVPFTTFEQAKLAGGFSVIHSFARWFPAPCQGQELWEVPGRQTAVQSLIWRGGDSTEDVQEGPSAWNADWSWTEWVWEPQELDLEKPAGPGEQASLVSVRYPPTRDNPSHFAQASSPKLGSVLITFSLLVC